ncbi:hypothetical protein BROUX41_000569 [Berkeleyomyces rouxiae]|uniref:uncharacterized protein n=1 Tax=Berkeleyomyces rouxiae TaxID=2035830 RepID=UPI003B7A0E2E
MRASSVMMAFAGLAAAKQLYRGVAIAGADFGCDIDGSCDTSQVVFPIHDIGDVDGAAQMRHFAHDDGLNMFRLPISWQFLTAHRGGSDLDKDGFEKYKKLMQACLDTGAYCQIDLHNFARFDNGIVGQGGPSNDVFAKLWTNIAAPWKDNDHVVFGLMNEPHDLDIQAWADTCQHVVNELRKSGAESQMILLPGTNFTNSATMIENGSAESMLAITNPDGSTDNLLLDIHQYLDIDNSGQHVECVRDNADSFERLADYLRKRDRQGMISETGASSDSSCIKMFCSQTDAILRNSDVYVGLVGWSAGSFKLDYIMTMTPRWENGKFINNELFTQCLVEKWANEPEKTTSITKSKSKTTTTTKHSSTETSESITTTTDAAETTSADLMAVESDSVTSTNEQSAEETGGTSGASALRLGESMTLAKLLSGCMAAIVIYAL